MRIFPPFILTTPKPGTTITGVLWCLTQGLLVPSFSCACRYVMGHLHRGRGCRSLAQCSNAEMLWGVSNTSIKHLLCCTCWLYLLSQPHASPGKALPPEQGEVTCFVQLFFFKCLLYLPFA